VIDVVTTTEVGNWNRWGKDDQRGTLNLLTPERVLVASQTCRTGKVYSLALPIGTRTTPRVADRPVPGRFTLSAPGDEDYYARRGAVPGVGVNEDLLMLASHTGTHMDALSHVYSGGTFYNGNPAAGFTPRRGASKCGIEHTATIAGRGVLLDLAGALRVPFLEPGHVITSEELEACRKAQGIELVGGDVLLLRTGWLEALLGADAPAPDRQPGLGLDSVSFLHEHDVAVVGADNAAVEAIPFDRGVYLGVHIELLVRLGMTLVEHLWLSQLAADRCYVSLVVIGGLPVVGATGSPVNPVAIG